MDSFPLCTGSIQVYRPVYYDTLQMKANNDTEAFDIELSDLTELYSYFKNGRLFYEVMKKSDATWSISVNLQDAGQTVTGRF